MEKIIKIVPDHSEYVLRGVPYFYVFMKAVEYMAKNGISHDQILDFPTLLRWKIQTANEEVANSELWRSWIATKTTRIAQPSGGRFSKVVLGGRDDLFNATPVGVLKGSLLDELTGGANQLGRFITGREIWDRYQTEAVDFLQSRDDEILTALTGGDELIADYNAAAGQFGQLSVNRDWKRMLVEHSGYVSHLVALSDTSEVFGLFADDYFRFPILV